MPGNGKSPKKIKVTPAELTMLYQVNTFVNGRIMPVSDEELYGEAEYWTYPEDAGDCEDMVLLKKKHLTALGFPPEALRITVVLDENMQGHAVLTVTTTEGDFVLDNRVNEIKLWSEVNYVLLKRQSAQDPKSWKSCRAIWLQRGSRPRRQAASEPRPDDPIGTNERKSRIMIMLPARLAMSLFMFAFCSFRPVRVVSLAIAGLHAPGHASPNRRRPRQPAGTGRDFGGRCGRRGQGPGNCRRRAQPSRRRPPLATPCGAPTIVN